MKVPALRYRLDVYTDKFGQWFVQVETYVGENPYPACEWTKTAATYELALSLAVERMRNNKWIVGE